MAQQPLGGLGRLIFRGFTITLRHTTLSKTPLDEWSARHRDLYLTTHNTHNRQTSMPPVGFEPTIPVSERPKTHALDRTATGIGDKWAYQMLNKMLQSVAPEDSCVLTCFSSSQRNREGQGLCTLFAIRLIHAICVHAPRHWRGRVYVGSMKFSANPVRSRSQWPCGLRRGSTAARLLG
jgi:hypothetical protein